MCPSPSRSACGITVHDQIDHQLTRRERAVLGPLPKESSTKSMRAEMYLPPHIVRNHARLLAKLGAHEKLQASAIAERVGVIGLEDVR